MTNGPVPPTPTRNEGEYARKLALAILSTLEQKGLLTRTDVDTILHAAHRASQPTPPPPVKITLGAPAPGPVPAPLGTRWVKPETLSGQSQAQTQAQPPQKPSQPASSQQRAEAAAPPAPAPGAIVIPSPEETQPVEAASELEKDQGHEEKVPQKKGEAQPPVIDFTLD